MRAPLALEPGAAQRQDRVALVRLGLEHVDEDRVADVQLGLGLGVAAVQLAVADDALGLGADVDEHLVLVDAHDVALDDIAVLEAADLAGLLVEQLLHGRRLGPIVDRGPAREPRPAPAPPRWGARRSRSRTRQPSAGSADSVAGSAAAGDRPRPPPTRLSAAHPSLPRRSPGPARSPRPRSARWRRVRSRRPRSSRSRRRSVASSAGSIPAT